MMGNGQMVEGISEEVRSVVQESANFFNVWEY